MEGRIPSAPPVRTVPRDPRSGKTQKELSEGIGAGEAEILLARIENRPGDPTAGEEGGPFRYIPGRE
ncbi:MAG: hypothetical protein METHP_00537 [Methanoregula sp. SKADARSKE-2]|nr:MAG: hypothetical protein METHP_00537 [Methanoregula sp. SKADARSKE-2]